MICAKTAVSRSGTLEENTTVSLTITQAPPALPRTPAELVVTAVKTGVTYSVDMKEEICGRYSREISLK